MIVLNGTMSDVYAQVLEINPNYEEDWTNHTLEARKAEERPHDVHCEVWDYGVISAVTDGIYYLRNEFDLPPGLKGNTCKIVSCSYMTAIRWCNDVCFPVHDLCDDPVLIISRGPL